MQPLARVIREAGKRDHLFVCSSTTTPGAMGSILIPMLERETGWKLNDGFRVCYNPEFIALGDVIRGLLAPDMVLIIVINVLDVNGTTKHHWMTMGYFSPALGDYVNHKLIPYEIGGERLEAVNAIEDPLNYRGRPRMKIPKFIINAVGDEYFPPDNTKFSYPLLPAKKSLRMLPNSKHSTAGTDIGESMTAWYDAIIRNRPVPDYSWTVREDGALVVSPGGKPSEVRLWQGTNSKARDFRVDVIGDKAFTSTVLHPQADGTYVGNIAPPETGFSAYFVELTYSSGTKYPFKFTTEVYVKPDILPYRWEDARPITAPDGK
jgi:PhoPQ-activated pathogenicity-related protein